MGALYPIPAVPNPQWGHLLDADTIALYKFAEDRKGVYSGNAVRDLGPNGYTLTLTGTPRIGAGPPGNARRDIFARVFQGSSDYCNSALLSTMPVLRQHLCQGGGEYTFEILYQALEGATFRGPFAITGDGESAATDFLLRLAGTPNSGSIEMFWERSGADQQIAVAGAPHYVPGEWLVLHAVFRHRGGDPLATKWAVQVYFSKPGSIGVLKGTYDQDAHFASGNGSKPATTSGTAAYLYIGQFDVPPSGFYGNVGNVRFVSRAMTAVEITAAATELLAQGEVTDGLPVLAHWDLNEAPDLFDEGPYGFHMNASWARYFGTEPKRRFDLVGTGGHPGACNGSAAQLVHRNQYNTYKTNHGHYMYQTFNDERLAVPTYTLEGWFVYADRAPSTSRYFAQHTATGETLNSNVLFLFAMSTTLRSFFFAERGLGVDLSQAPANSALLNVNEARERYGKFHWAIRVRENPSVPGQALIEHFVNGNLVATHAMSGIPQGGSDSMGIIFGNWEGWIQDLKVSRVARTDAEIMADFLRCSMADYQGETTPPTVTNIDPPGGLSLDPFHAVTFDVGDDTALLISAIWCKYRNSTKRLLIYDGILLFSYPFTDASTMLDVNGDGTLWRFSLYPTGGWPDDIEQLRVRVIDQAGNLDELVI